MAPSSVLRKLPVHARRRLTRIAFSGTDVSTHGAVAFLDPPANGALTSIGGAIEGFPCGSFPLAVARQAMPEMEADPGTRGAGDRLNSGAHLLGAARLPHSA